MQLVLRVLSVLPAAAINAAVALDLHSQFGSICGLCRTIRILWEDRISLLVQTMCPLKQRTPFFPLLPVTIGCQLLGP